MNTSFPLIHIGPDMQPHGGCDIVEAGVAGEATGKHVHTVELGVRSDTIHFIDELRDFHLNLHPVFRGVDPVGSLNGKFSDSLKNIRGFLEVAFSSLNEGDTVCGIPTGLLEAADLGPHLLGNGQTGGIVACPVDP